MKDVDLGEPTSFLDHVCLGCTQRECQTCKDIVDNYRSMFESKISAGATEKLPLFWETWRKHLFLVLWYGRSCQEMCRKILWVAEQNDSTTLQSIYSMPWWPSTQRRRIWIWWRIVKGLLTNCSEMLTLGTYWTTWFSMVSEQACTIGHKMDQSLWQTIRPFDLLHSSYMWLQTILLCANTAKTMQTGTVSRLRFCGRSWGFNIYIRWNFYAFLDVIHLFQQVGMCKKQTAVSHSSTEAEIISIDAGLRMDGIPALDLWDLVLEVFHSSPNQFNYTKDQVRRNSSRDTTSNKLTQNKTPRFQPRSTILIWTMLTVFNHTKDQVRRNSSRDTTSNKLTQNKTQGSNPARHFWSEQCWLCFAEREVFSIRCDAVHIWE